MNLFDLFAKISLDSSEYEEQMNEAEGKTNSFGDRIQSALSAGAKVVAAGITATATAATVLTKKAVDAYASYEQLVGGVETLFKDSAGIVLQYANDAFKTAGLSANQYMEIVTGFTASLLRSLNDDTEQAAVYADMALQDMSDNANKFGTAFESIQFAYQGFAKQNYTMLDNLKLGYGGTATEMARLINDSGVLGDAMIDLGDSTKIGAQLQEVGFAKIVEAIHVIQQRMGVAGTTAKEAASTITGSWSSVRGAFENVLVGISDDSQDFGRLINNLVDSVGAYADNMLPRIQTAFNGVGRLITALSPTIAAAVPSLIKSVAPAMLEAGVNMLGSLASGLAMAVPDVLDAVTDAADMILTQLNDGLDNLSVDGFIDQFIKSLVSIGEKAAGIAPKLISGLTNAFRQVADWMLRYSSEFTDIVIELVQGLVSAIVQNAGEFVSAVSTVMASIATALLHAAPKLLAVVPELVEQVIAEIQSELPQIVETARFFITHFITTMADMAPDLISMAGTLVTQLVQAIADPELISGVTTAAQQIVTTLISGISKAIPALLEQVPIIVTTIATAITSNLPSLAAAGGQILASILSGLESTLPDVLASISAIVSSLATSFLSPDVLQQVLQAGSQVLQAFLSGVQKALPSLLSFVPKLFKQFIGAVNDNLEQVLEVGLSLVEMLITGIVEALPTLSESVLEVITAITDTLLSEDAVAAFLEVATSIIGTLVQGIVQAIPTLTAMVPQIVTQMVTVLTSNLPQILQTGISVLKSLIQGLTQSMPELVTAAVSIIQLLVTELTTPEMLNMLITSAISMIEAIGNGLIEALPKLLEQVPVIIENVVEAITENLPQILETGISLVLAIVEGIVKAAPQIISAIVEMIPEIVEAVFSMIPEIVNVLTDPQTLMRIIRAGGDILKALVDGLIQSVGQLLKVGPKVISSIIDGVMNAFGNLSILASELIDKLKANLTGKMSVLKDAGKAMLNTIGNGVKSTFSSVVNWGKDLMDNFISGIKSKIGDLKNTVKGIGQKIKDFLGFSEPKEGPLSNFHTFAPDMMDLFARGIRENDDIVTNQIRKSFDFGELGSFDIGSVTGRIEAPAQRRESVLFGTLQETMAEILTWMREHSNMEIHFNDGTWAGQLAPAMDLELGRINKGRERLRA